MGWGIKERVLSVVGIVRYGLPQRHMGRLSIGDPMPDATLRDDDGNPFRLADLGVGRPLVLIFGSYT